MRKINDMSDLAKSERASNDLPSAIPPDDAETCIRGLFMQKGVCYFKEERARLAKAVTAQEKANSDAAPASSSSLLVYGESALSKKYHASETILQAAIGDIASNMEITATELTDVETELKKKHAAIKDTRKLASNSRVVALVKKRAALRAKLATQESNKASMEESLIRSSEMSESLRFGMLYKHVNDAAPSFAEVETSMKFVKKHMDQFEDAARDIQEANEEISITMDARVNDENGTMGARHMTENDIIKELEDIYGFEDEDEEMTGPPLSYEDATPVIVESAPEEEEMTVVVYPDVPSEPAEYAEEEEMTTIYPSVPTEPAKRAEVEETTDRQRSNRKAVAS